MMFDVVRFAFATALVLALSMEACPTTAWVSALKPKGLPGKEITLASEGKANYRIMLPETPTSQDRKAAEDLKQWLEEMSGARFAIESEVGSPGDFISIGHTKAVAEVQGFDANLGRDGYAILQQGRNLFLIGGSRRGPINAVYALLEEDLDCRWYEQKSSSVPHRAEIKFRPVPRSYVPALDIRDPFYWDAFNMDWSIRNRTLAPLVRVPEEWGGTTDYASFGHAFDWLIPPDEYFESHPEYFSEVDGERKKSQLCLTNPDVLRISIEKVKDRLRSRPNADLVSISQNDCRGYCHCPKCRAIDEAEGTYAGTLIRFVNAIADAIRDEFPNIRVSTLAYMDTTEAPKTIKPRDNVVVQLCTDRHAWRNPFLAQPETERFQNALEGWHKLGANLSIWDYTVNFHHYPIVMPNWPVVDQDIDNLIKHGAQGIMLQGAHQSFGCENGPMRAWVWGKKLWDPSLDSKALMRDFVFGYYREAAAPMWEYTRMLRDMWEHYHSLPKDENLMFCGIRYYPDTLFLDKFHFLNKAMALVSAAEKAANSSEIRRRVALAKFPLLYLEISQDVGFVDYYKVFQPKIKQGTKDLARQKVLIDEFEAIGKAEHVTHIREGKPDFETKIQQLRDVLAADLSQSVIETLNDAWRFRKDPKDEGVTESWFENGFDDSSWIEITSGKNANCKGVSWYRGAVELPDEAANYKHAYLWFGAVGDEAYIYMNGKKAFEHSVESTALPMLDLRQRPFFFDAKDLLWAGSNKLAVRVNSIGSPAGIWKPARIILTNEDDLPRVP